MRLYLLRHGEVTSHKGDVPITGQGETEAFEVGRWLGQQERSPMRILSGETRRAIDTAGHLARGLVAGGGEVLGPDVAFALRNPDLYVSGTRVNMVSSAEALAEQVDGLSVDDVTALGFFPEFFSSPDRIGWWLSHPRPPGEDVGAVAARMRSFAESLLDPMAGGPDVVIGVTHSPLIRAMGLDFLGHDIGEPAWVSGLLITVNADRSFVVDPFVPGPA